MNNNEDMRTVNGAGPTVVGNIDMNHDWVVPGATYLITGGSGVLAGHLAAHILSKATATVALLSRTPASSDRPGIVNVCADVTDVEGLQAALNELRSAYGKIRGIFHLAGVTQDSALIQKSFADFDRVLAPKIQGLQNLDMATRDDPLDLFVGFSSVAAVVGNAGQADYAVANAFLDRFLQTRQNRVSAGAARGRSLSINWPFWADGGMRAAGNDDPTLGHESGVKALSLHAGFRALADALAQDASQVAVFSGDTQKLSVWLGHSRPSEGEAKSSLTIQDQSKSAIVDPLLRMIDILRTEISDILRFDLEEVTDRIPVSELGLDSITYADLAERLNTTFGITVTPPELFDAAQIEDMAGRLLNSYPHLVELLQPPVTQNDTARAEQEAQQSVAFAESSKPPFPADDDAVAIVGMHCRFPGGPTPEEFWDLLEQNKTAITDVPRDRWAVDEEATTHDGPRYGGFVDNIDLFDPIFFGISPREANWMDPQQRILLETVWHAFENAGLRRDQLDGLVGGVFVGASSNDYGVLMSEKGTEMSAHRSTGLAHAILPNRISHVFDLTGPSEAIDTACSSSLVAANRAIRALRSGECEFAVLAGVNAMLSPDLFNAFNASGMLSPTGLCHTFDETADGYVRGEGVGAMIMMPLNKAQKMGLRVRAIVRGVAVNHVGHTSSLTVPSIDAQSALIHSALADGGLTPADISAIEAHGTGTSLGDPIEIGGLKAVFGGGSQQSNDIVVTSAKSKIGHLESAAGIAGMISAVLSLEAARIPGNPQLKSQNPLIDLSGTPLRLATSSVDWIASTDAAGHTIPRRIGVSSFGFGGTNGHVILEEARREVKTPDYVIHASGAVPIQISAHSPSALRAQIDLLSALVAAKPDLSAGDVASALCHQRTAFDYRVAFAAQDSNSLLQGLATARAAIDEEMRPCPKLGLAKRQSLQADFVKLSEEGFGQDGSVAERVVQMFIEGADLDWSALFARRSGKMIDLPLTVFDHARYWFQTNADQGIEVPLEADAAVLTDHVVMGRKILPGAGSVALLLDVAAREEWVSSFSSVQLNDVKWIAHVGLTEIAGGLAASHSLDGVVRLTSGQKLLFEAKVSPLSARSETAFAPPKKGVGVSPSKALYDQFSGLGIQYGPSFQRLQQIDSSADVSIANIVPMPEGGDRVLAVSSALDAAFQTIFGFARDTVKMSVPTRAAKIQIFAPLTQVASAICTQHTPKDFNFDLLDSQGELVAHMERVTFQPVQLLNFVAPAIYEHVWRPSPIEQGQSAGIHSVLMSNNVLLTKAFHGVAVVAEVDHELKALSEVSERLDYGIEASVFVLDLRDISLTANGQMQLLRLYRSKAKPAGVIILVSHSNRSLSAFLRSVAAEYADLWAKVIVVDQMSPTALADILRDECALAETADIDWTSGSRSESSLAIIDLHSAERVPAIPKDSVCLIAGGLGGIGRKLADDIIHRFGAKVALIGRGSPDLETSEWMSSTSNLSFYQCDVTDADDLASAVAQVSDQVGRVSHTFHLAGTLQDQSAANLTQREIEKALDPKLLGFKNLAAATTAVGVDCIVAFSSASAVFGSKGQAAYAAANGAMSDYALALNNDVPVRVIDWPLWAEGGMSSGTLKSAYAAQGLATLENDEAFELLYRLIASPHRHVTVAKFLNEAPDNIDLTQAFEVTLSATDTLGIPMLRAELETYLRGEISDVLGLAAHKLQLAEPLERYGLDSALVLELTERLERQFGKIPKTVFFEYPSISNLLDYFSNRPVVSAGIASNTTDQAAPATVVHRKEANAEMEKFISDTGRAPIAIVGMSARFPGADTLDAFWKNISEGRDCITPIPEDRWDNDRFFDGDPTTIGTINLSEGGFISGHDQFDTDFFRIPARDAKRIDPQERLFLMESWRALEDAGYPPTRLKRHTGGKVGVFAGAMWSEYQLYGRFEGAVQDQISLGSSFASIANRVSFFLGLSGPSIGLDTMCSSSLSALHLACNAIHLGECKMALAGGVNLSLHPNKFLQLSQSSFAAPDGRCHSFGAGGSGYGPGEGVGVVLLRPLADAIADGDRILGVIRGSAVNHGGAVTGFTVPNPNAQAEVIESAWKRAGLDPLSADYVEAHGTGTPLGDPIEIRGLAKVFSGHQSLPIGSVKSNVGHLEAAAGMVALAKVIGQVSHEKLVPTIHTTPLNPDLEIDGTGLTIQVDAADWPRRIVDGIEQPYRVGISSFGAGGANAHLVFEEQMTTKPKDDKTAAQPYLILLSGRSQAALQQRLVDLSDWVAKQDGIRIVDVAYTLAVGRCHFEKRFAIVAQTIEELQNALHLALGSTPNSLSFSTEFLRNNFENIPDNAMRGWAEVYLEQTTNQDPPVMGLEGYVVPLPSYPFETKRVWVNDPTVPKEQVVPPISKPELDKKRTTSQEINRMPDTKTAQSVTVTNDLNMLGTIQRILAGILEEDPALIPVGKPFSEIGLDSIHAVQFARKLSDAITLEVAVADLYNNSTISRLAAYLSQELAQASKQFSDQPETTQVVPERTVSRDPVVKQQPAQPSDVDTLLQTVRSVLSAVLEEDLATLSDDRPFKEMGVDSVHSVQIARLLSGAGQEITAMMLYDFPTIRLLATHLGTLGGENAPKQTSNLGEGTQLAKPVPKLPSAAHTPANEPLGLSVALHANSWPNSHEAGVPLTNVGGERADNSHTRTVKAAIPSESSSKQVPLQIGERRRKAALVRSLDYLDQVDYVDDIIAAPLADTVEIAVEASSISLSDLMRMRGIYPEMPVFPFAAGVEVAGVVTRIGPDVTDIDVGDRVTAMMSKTFGGHATLTHAHKSAVWKIPEQLTFEAACTLPSSFLTAYYGLVDLGRVDKGETVLVHSAASALGQMVIQLAWNAGATVIATTSMDEKVEFLRAQGIETVVNYETEDFKTAVLDATGGKGVDIVFNMLGPDKIQQGIDCLAEGGRYLEAALGSLKAAPRLDIGSIADNKAILSVGLRSLLWNKGPDKVRKYFDILREMVNQGDIQALPFSSFHISDFRGAIAHIQSRKSVGKTLLLSARSDHADDDIDAETRNDTAHDLKSRSEEIAIIGMAGRFGSAGSPKALWQALIEGQNLVGPMPTERKNLGFGTQSIGSFVSEIDKFDPQFFDITPKEAEWMDPQQRILLEEVWKAIEDAGITTATLQGSSTGVFVGARGSNYAETRVSDGTPQSDLHAFTGGLGSILAGRIAYTFDLRGPAVTLDTACSSGAVALDMAVKSLRSGECDLAIVAGVSIGTAPGLSPGEATACRAFDNDANGFVIGEGLGVLILKRTKDATDNQDRSHGQILATATNQDGLSNGLLAPNGRSQADLLNTAWRQAGISANEIGMIEAHGTGTVLGDPVEFAALQSTVSQETQTRQFCALGSIKSNLGHTLAAAGIVGVIKVLLSMKAEKIPPSLHFKTPNEHINFDDSAFFVPTRSRSWNVSHGKRRIGGVSAFGFSGTNAHVVVAEPLKSAFIPRMSANKPALIVVSAKTKDALDLRIRELGLWLSDTPNVELGDLAYTLAHRRTHLAYRAAFVVTNRSDLLAAFNGSPTEPVRDAKLTDAKSAFLAEDQVDWSAVVPETGCRLLDLPCYPFMRKSCFRDIRQTRQSADLPVTLDERLPLFGRVTTDNQGRYVPINLVETDFFLADHKVVGRPVLPGVVTLDLVARLARCLPEVGEKYVISDVVFIRPCIVDEKTEARLRFSEMSNNNITVRLYALDRDGVEMLCSQARIVAKDSVDSRTDDVLRLAELERQCTARHGAGECYSLICSTSIHHGPSLQTIKTVHSSETSCLAYLSQASGSGTLADFELHPGLMDGALQSLVGFAFGRTHGDTHMPFSIDEVRQHHPLTTDVIVNLRSRNTSTDDKQMYDIDLADTQGRISVSIRGLMHRKVVGKLDKPDPAALPDGVTGIPYVPEWRALDVPARHAPSRVAILKSTNVELDRMIVEAFESAGHATTIVGMQLPNGAVPSVPALSELLHDSDPLDAIVCAWELAAPDDAPDLKEWIAVFQAIGARKDHTPLRLIVPISEDTAAFAYKAGLSSLLRTVVQETPNLQSRFLRLNGPTAELVPEICRYGFAGDDPLPAEDIMLNSQGESAKRRVFVPISLAETSRRAFEADTGCIVVTGGAGGIGKQVAMHAACVWGADVVLMGRRDEDQRTAAVLDSLRAHGVRATYVALDVTDAQLVKHALENVRTSFGPIGGVIHCAGVLDDRLLRDVDLESFLRTASPKIDAVANLDRATRQDKLAFFITMSSLGGLTGNSGQGAYTYGSGVMDALIARRQVEVIKRHAHGRSLTLNWPLWADGGMSVDEQSEIYMRRSLGLVPMPGAYGIRLLERALATEETQIGVLVGETDKISTFFDPANQNSEDSDVPKNSILPVDAAQIATPKTLIPVLMSLVAEVSGWDETNLDPTEELSSFGFDSVMLTGLTNAINERFDIQLPPAEVFAHPTVVALADCLIKNHALTLSSPVSAEEGASETVVPITVEARLQSPVARASKAAGHNELLGDIAVIGQSARYPNAATLEKFWENLASGRDSVGQVPATRWTGPRFEIEGQPELSKFGGFLDDITHFEPAFFGISPAEAEMMDPQERLFLEVAHSTFENGGYGRTRLKSALEGDVGVFVGVMWSEFQLFSNSTQGEFGSSPSTLANRISFFYDLCGPSLALDTMCSSSLTALHLACQSLRSKECRAALVGGINMSLHQNKYTRLSRNRFMSVDGKCRAFGADGTGYVPGEGIGGVLLKSLEDALNDGDHVHAIIKGSAVNHGGRTSGFTVPNGDAQAKVVAQAFKQANVEPSSITYLETHGTGTPLGDPVEIYGLSRAFGDVPLGQCAIGSVKTNVGHLEAAAGMAGLHKVILQMQHGKIAPSLHSNPPNLDIDFSKTPFRVNDVLSDWTGDAPLRAGLSSFGAGGANSHVIIEEAPCSQRSSIAGGPHLFVLSARTPESLHSNASELARFMAAKRSEIPLEDIAKTLCVGRDQMRVRAAFVCETEVQLIQILLSLGQGDYDQLSFAEIKSSNIGEVINVSVSGFDPLSRLAVEWTGGATINGDALPGRIVPLPTYQFNNKPYWFDESGYGQSSKAVSGTLDGTLIRNANSVVVAVKSSDPIATDHVISGKMILAGATVLELARAGAEMLRGQPVRELENVAWLTPAQLVEGGTLRLKSQVDEERGTLSVEDGETGRKFCQAKIASADGLVPPDSMDLQALRSQCPTSVDVQKTYADLASKGYAYGPLFRTLRALFVGQSQALGKLEIPNNLSADFERYVLHPAILDGAFQSVLGVLSSSGGVRNSAPYLPFLVGKITIYHAAKAGPVWVHSRLTSSDQSDTVTFDLTLFDEDGHVLANIEKFMLRKLRPNSEQSQNPRKETARMPETPHTEPQLPGRIRQLVETFFCETLKLSESDVTPDLLLEECGLDSIILMELTRIIEDDLGAGVTPSELVGLVTLGDLIEVLETAFPTDSAQKVERTGAEQDVGAASPEPIAPTKATTEPRIPAVHSPRKVAIIGMSCRLPGSMNEDEFWDHLLNERNLITETPADRWDWRDSFDPRKGQPGKTYSKWNGFCSLMGAYDIGMFKISPEHAEHLDPQQLLMLELARDAFENAGYSPEEFAGKDTAVVLGAAGRSVETKDDPIKQKSVVVSKIQNMIAARISDFYDLHGTSYTMDTACSSSLVAMHDACRIIQTGDATTALAGGVVIFTSERGNIGFSAAQVLSDDGNCYVFDKRAKGIVLSEGAGLFLLKDYEQALADGDNIRAVIAASAVNNDGKTMGLTTPNGKMQSAVIQKALSNGNIDPRSVTYLETHGTGTLLGDPIEIKAATDAYRKFTEDKGFCGVASVKANVGHLLLASGVASVVKVVKALETGILPATIHCDTPHPRFNFPETPFYPLQKKEAWNPDCGQRRAAISAFGFGGTNCHMVFDEFNAAENNHDVKRAPLPRTKYNRVPVWDQLGVTEPVQISPQEPKSEPTGEPQNLEEILTALQAGSCSVEQALELQKRLGIVGN